MILDTPQKRREQVQKTTATIINSMRHTTPYIDIKTASELLKFTDRGASKCLNRMVTMNLLRKHKVKNQANRSFDVFCATKHGREFMTGSWRLKKWTMKSWRLANHNHDMQLHLLNQDLQNLAWERNYKNIEAVTFNKNKNQRRSDFALRIENTTYQIELELTRKSKERYQKIIFNCSSERKKAPFVWVFKDPKLLKIFYYYAKQSDHEDDMEFILWRDRKIKWVKALQTPLFSKHFEGEKFEFKDLVNTDDMYDQWEVDNLIQKARQEEKAKLDKIMRMGVFERNKFIKNYLKNHLPM